MLFRSAGPGTGAERHVMRMLESELGLTRQQAELFRAHRHQHFRTHYQLSEEIFNCKKLLMETITTDTSADNELAALAAKMGDLYTRRELKTVRHFNKLKTLCTPEQQEKLKSLLRELLPRSQRMMHERRGSPRGRGRGRSRLRELQQQER